MENFKKDIATVRVLKRLKNIGFTRDERKELLTTTGVKNLIKAEIENVK